MLDVMMLLGLALLVWLYLSVPALGPRLVVWTFPGSSEQAKAALDLARRLSGVPVVARAAAGAMAEEMPSAGLWVLSTLPRWSWSVLWPLWLPGSVRGTVRGALATRHTLEARLDG